MLRVTGTGGDTKTRQVEAKMSIYMIRIWIYDRGNFLKKIYLGVVGIKGCGWVQMGEDGFK